MAPSHDTTFLTEVIPSDFDVKKVAYEEGWVLYAAFRKDLLQLVEYSAESGGITQYHVPLVSLAMALDEGTTRLGDLSEGEALVLPALDGIAVGTQAPGGEHYLVVPEGAIPFDCLDADFAQRLLGLPATLATARKKVTGADGAYTLPGAVTFHEQPVGWNSRPLLESIAFEKSVRRRLNARNFGVYSAFCTHVDIPCPLANDSCLTELIDAHFDCYGDELPDNGLVDAAADVQKALFPFPVWGPDIAVDRKRAVEGLRAAVRKLTPVQATQVVLLNGMHGADVFLALGAAAGIISFEAYRDFQTEHFQADSEEEQSVRTSASFIELFGQLADPDEANG